MRFLDDRLGPELAWLDIHLHEVSQPESAARYRTFAQALGGEARYVPAFFYCGISFHGYDEDDTTGRFLRDDGKQIAVGLNRMRAEW